MNKTEYKGYECYYEKKGNKYKGKCRVFPGMNMAVTGKNEMELKQNFMRMVDKLMIALDENVVMQYAV